MRIERSLFQLELFLIIVIAVLIACKPDVPEDSLPDTFPPAVKSISPSDSAKNIEIDTSFSLTFVEEVDVTTVTVNTEDNSCSGSIQVSKDDFTSCVKMVSSPIANSNKKSFSIQPSTNLDSNTTYKIKLTSGIKDLSENVSVVSYVTSSGFTTLDIQWVSSTSPSNGDVDVSISPIISVTFAQAVDTSTVTTNIADTGCSGSIQVSKDDFSTCLQMAGDPLISNNNQTFTVQPVSDLEGSTTYKIKITSAVMDATGGNGLLTDYITTTGFTTHETVPPVISSFCPPDGTSTVEFDTPLKITFNEGMETSTITTNTSDNSCSGCIQVSIDDFSTCVQMSNSPIPGINNSAFLVQPASNLSSGATYKIRVTTDAKDIFGNAMSNQYTASSGFDVITNDPPETKNDQGSVTGGTVNLSFTVPSGTDEIKMTVRLAGDFGSTSEYSTVYFNGYDIGTASSGVDDTTFVTPPEWDSEPVSSSYWSAGSTANIALVATSGVNFDPGGGFYYKYEITLEYIKSGVSCSGFQTTQIETETDQGSTAGGAVGFNFSIPSGATEVNMTVKLAGDFELSTEYSTVYFDGHNIGTVSSDEDGITLVTPTGWDKKSISSSYWTAGSPAYVELVATDLVNYDTGGGYYYLYEVTLEYKY
jgi:hypothetical protein